MNGKTGLYLEDCHISEPIAEGVMQGGYRELAYDAEGAKNLWELSNTLSKAKF